MFTLTACPHKTSTMPLCVYRDSRLLMTASLCVSQANCFILPRIAWLPSGCPHGIHRYSDYSGDLEVFFTTQGDMLHGCG